MSATPLSTPTSSKKNRRRVADSIGTASSQPSSVSSLLAALNKAQKVDTTSNVVEVKRLSVGETVRRIRKEKEAEKRRKAAETSAKGATGGQKAGQPSRSRGGSVGARMTVAPPGQSAPPTTPQSSHTKRQRHNSNSVQTFVNKQYALSVQLTPQRTGGTKQRIPSDVVDDLDFRFLANLPAHEKFDSTRMCFQLELAHWFYVDFYCDQEARTDCPKLGMREFARQMFLQLTELSHLVSKVDEVIDEWRHYKSNVPTYGAILLDSTLNNVLLVQGYYASKNSWGFPKGKVNENEDPRVCAIREVFEETGYDFGEFSHGGEPMIQKFINETMVRLYVVPDVRSDYPFAPRTRNEIRKIQWFNVWDLPTDRNDQQHKLSTASNNNFYTVMPFVVDLQNIIKKEQAKRQKIKQRSKRSNPDANYLTDMDSVIPQSIQPTPGTTNDPSSISNLFNNFFPGSTKSGKPNQPMSNSLPVPVSMPNTRSDVPIVSTQSHFRPVGNSPAAGQGGSSIIDMLKAGPSSSAVPVKQIAHPIPIQAKAVIAPPTKPVYVAAPKQNNATRTTRLSASETSAFKAIPPSKTTVTETVSVAQIEDELQKLLGPIVPPAAVPALVPAPGPPVSTTQQQQYQQQQQQQQQHRDSVMSSATDITSEMVFPFGVSPRSKQTAVVGGSLHTVHIQKCDAWKSFKLDTRAIFEGIPGFNFPAKQK